MKTQPAPEDDPYATARNRYGDAKHCPPCGCLHPLEDFTIKDPAKGLLQSKCKVAVRNYGKGWYAANAASHIKTGAARKVTERERTGAKLAAFLARCSCSSCGGVEDLTAVVTGPGTRGRSPRALTRDGWTWLRLEPLLEQSVASGLVLCAFCARRRP